MDSHNMTLVSDYGRFCLNVAGPFLCVLVLKDDGGHALFSLRAQALHQLRGQ